MQCSSFLQYRNVMVRASRATPQLPSVNDSGDPPPSVASDRRVAQEFDERWTPGELEALRALERERKRLWVSASGQDQRLQALSRHDRRDDQRGESIGPPPPEPRRGTNAQETDRSERCGH